MEKFFVDRKHLIIKLKTFSDLQLVRKDSQLDIVHTDRFVPGTMVYHACHHIHTSYNQDQDILV